MRLWLGPFLLACAASAFAADSAPMGDASSMTLGGELQQASATVHGQPFAFSVRRYAGAKSKPQAYERLEGALQDLAKEQGVQTAERADTALTVEVDSTFYVYTNRFNARLVRLPEYTQAQLDGAPTVESVRTEQKPDMVRIAAGALGIVRGWISPAFGSYMISGGATPALFGEGKAPTRLFVAGKERYERGEQEVNTKVRVLRGSEVVAAFSVRNWSAGDEPPFKIDSLVAENWTTVFARRPAGRDALVGRSAMSGRGTGIRQGCRRKVEGRLSSELRLPCFTSLSRRFNVMTALRRSSPGAQRPGAVFWLRRRGQ